MSDRPSRREPIRVSLPARVRSSFAPSLHDERYDTTNGRSLAYAVPPPAAPPAPLLASFGKFCSAASLGGRCRRFGASVLPLAADFPAPRRAFRPSAPASAPPFDAKSSSLFFTSRSTRPGLSPPRRSAPMSALAVRRSRPAGGGDHTPRAPASRAVPRSFPRGRCRGARRARAAGDTPRAVSEPLSSRCFFSRTYAVGSNLRPGDDAAAAAAATVRASPVSDSARASGFETRWNREGSGFDRRARARGRGGA